MRAVNLLPSDLRSAAVRPARGARPEPVQGVGAYVVLGALALCLAALASYVLLTNGIEQRETDLVAAQQRATAAEARAAALKPYADFEARANARIQTVRDLAASRFDWEQALRDISHAVPGDIKLETLNGDTGLPGTSPSGGDALRASITAPAISLAGCASSHANVARMMSRVKAVDGVTRVSLSKSDSPPKQAGGGTELACRGDSPTTFSVVVFFERSEALTSLDTTTGVPATAATPAATPAPGGTGGTTPPAATATPQPTSTTGGTP